MFMVPAGSCFSTHFSRDALGIALGIVCLDSTVAQDIQYMGKGGAALGTNQILLQAAFICTDTNHREQSEHSQ